MKFPVLLENGKKYANFLQIFNREIRWSAFRALTTESHCKVLSKKYITLRQQYSIKQPIRSTYKLRLLEDEIYL